MEPHAAQDRLSFVCNWKHMHSEARSKAEPPRRTGSPHPNSTLLHLPSSSLPPGSGLPHFGPSQSKWQVTLQNLRAFIELSDLALHVKFSSMGWLYRVSCESFKPPRTEIWVAVESLLRKEALTLSLTCFENTSGTILFIRHGLWCLDVDGPRVHGRSIINSYITDFWTEARLHKGRMYDIY